MCIRDSYSTISIYARIGANPDRLVTELLAKSNEVKSQLPPCLLYTSRCV